MKSFILNVSRYLFFTGKGGVGNYVKLSIKAKPSWPPPLPWSSLGEGIRWFCQLPTPPPMLHKP